MVDPPPRYVWRDAALLFNSFGCTGDLLEKVFIYIVVVCLCGIGMGAHAAFTTASAWVATCAFCALFFIAAVLAVYGAREPRLREASTRSERGRRRRPLWRAVRTNVVVLVALTNMVAAAPYLAAAFLDDPVVIVRLYWTGTALALLRTSVLPVALRALASFANANPVMPAVNIEAISEKYTLLTLSTLGRISGGGGGRDGQSVGAAERERLTKDRRVSWTLTHVASRVAALTCRSGACGCG